MQFLFHIFLCRSGVFNLFIFLVNVYDFVHMSRIFFFFLEARHIYHDDFLGIRILNLIFCWGSFQLHRDHHKPNCSMYIMRAVIFEHLLLFGSFHFPTACTFYSFILAINFLNLCFSNLLIVLLGILKFFVG